ncbi:hypothetical protein C5167_019168 [Papaver somniferum]|uniref:Gnk2-homologous domain-containing protein n=1 Tax=Papaver somniferum TaxID=3469 RepID=A0A4Y7ISN3_PAPSO|nr:cysteine-rich receptor-like protein kinase 25 [Papaver somniferum]RZC50731.1 hypothetical protein C5167_019168 [Papaver somniferum]
MGAVGNISDCCYGRKGGIVLRPSCNIRYESYPFYDYKQETNPGHLPSSPPPKPNVTATTGGTVNNGFSNRTNGNNLDKVHGLFLCRGDQTNDACQSCVTTAAEEITKKCPNKKDAIIYYDECMVRYSNQSMVQKNPGVSLFNMNNASDPDRFKPLLGELLEELVTRATANSSKFSTGTKGRG